MSKVTVAVAACVFACLMAAAAGDAARDFRRIKSCDECIERGFGWCPKRRACGGFANRKCIGGNDERDFARSRVVVVTDADMDFDTTYHDTTRNQLVLVYNSSSTSTAIVEAFENAAVDAEAGDGGPAFLSVDVQHNSRLALRHHDPEGPLPVVLAYRKSHPASDDGPRKPVGSFTGPYTPEAIVEWMQDVATARIPTIDAKVKPFMESFLMALTGDADSADVAAADMMLIWEDVQEYSSGLSGRQSEAAAVYAQIMQRLMDSPRAGMGWLSGAINAIRGDGQATDELEILQVFASELLG